MTDPDDAPRPPARLRALASWQTSRVSTLGARLFARHMPLGARADFAVLAALEEYGPLSQAGLGRRLRLERRAARGLRLGLDRNDVNGIVNRLEQQHRIERRADPADRRRNIVTMTGAGQQH